MPFGVLAEELGVIAQRERDRLEPLLDVPDHRPEVTPADVAAHVDPAGGPVALDDVRGRLDLDVGDVGQADAAAARRVDEQVADAGQALARGRRAPDLHVVGLAGPEQVGDLLARDQGRRGSTNVAGLEPVSLGRREVHLDVDLRDVDDEVGVGLDDPIHTGEDVVDVVGEVPKDLQVGPVDADHEVLARPGQDLVDPLVEVRLDVRIQPGVAGGDLLDRGQGRVIVRGRVDADPVLGEVDPGDLLALERLADVRSEVAHARDRPQLPAALLDDPDLFGVRGPGRGHPVHQEVALLEGREERLRERRGHGHAGDDHGEHGAERPARPAGRSGRGPRE